MKHFKLKIIISVYVCLISLAFYNAFHSYNNSIKLAKQAVFNKLSTASNILAIQIDGDMHDSIIKNFNGKDDIKTSEQNANYLKIHQLLAVAQKSANLNTPIYTLVRDKDKPVFYFGVTSSEKPYYKHSYHKPPIELTYSYTKGGFIDEYKDENGIWLSSFSPIKNKKGEVVAIVQADLNFEDFITNIRGTLIENILFVLFIYTVIGLLLYFFLKDVLKQQDIYTNTQKRYKERLEVDVADRTKELNIVNSKLLGVNKELESFFYSTSHDIRGPLCRIMGLSNLAKFEDEKQELVELIEIESIKMDTMLRKMIAVNNIRTKPIKSENVEIFNIINRILVATKLKYNHSKAEVVIKTETQSLKNFVCDKELLEAIIINLLDNAFKFSDAVNPKINILGFIDENGILSFSVSNNGQKFSNKALSNAFELFKNANYNDEAGGIRLGLYTVKTALNKLSGLVEINQNEQTVEVKILIPDMHISNHIQEILVLKK